MLILCDIDGVLADVRHLLYLIDNKLPKAKRNYDEYYRRIGEAKPIQAGIELVTALVNEGHDVVFITARRLASKEPTEKWLQNHLFYGPSDFNKYGLGILMRPDGDERLAHEVKRDLLEIVYDHTGYELPTNTIAIDDDRRNAKMFAEQGIYTLQVRHETARSD